MPYTPTLIDTSAAAVPPDLANLTERLAEHVHDLWAARRLADGWTYGAQRDDVAKTHPGLVPYRDLPEAEKDYDRQTALGTISAILTFGYQIVPGAPALGGTSREPPAPEGHRTAGGSAPFGSTT